METAKIFETGRSQAVRLPKKFRFDTDEVVIQQLGNAVILVPKESLWLTFMNGINSFSDDFFEQGREQGTQERRIDL
jgi:antitoxin VapB